MHCAQSKLVGAVTRPTYISGYPGLVVAVLSLVGCGPIMVSVVTISPATEAAFGSATRTTFARSRIPIPMAMVFHEKTYDKK